MRELSIGVAAGCWALLVVARGFLLGFTPEAIRVLREQPPREPSPNSRWNQLIGAYRSQVRGQAVFFGAAVIGVISASFASHPRRAIVELVGIFLIVLTTYLFCASLSLGLAAYRVMRTATPPVSRGDAGLLAGWLVCTGWGVAFVAAVACQLWPD